MRAFSFPKSDRLNKKKIIQELFDKGSTFYLYPFKVFYAPNEGASSSQVLITVSKKNFGRAVDRNLIKRRVREAFRLNQGHLADNKNYQIAYIYTAKEILDFSKIQEKVVKSFKKLENEKES